MDYTYVGVDPFTLHDQITAVCVPNAVPYRKKTYLQVSTEHLLKLITYEVTRKNS